MNQSLIFWQKNEIRFKKCSDMRVYHLKFTWRYKGLIKKHDANERSWIISNFFMIKQNG